MTIYEEYKQTLITVKTLNQKIKAYKKAGTALEYIWALEDQKVQAKRELQFLLTTI
tara:strand:+ start:133 stop:300 length:168 start_codon:yes stop_codon:yes gene_type:complete